MKTTQQHIDISSGKIFIKRWAPTNLKSSIPIILMHDSLGSVEQWRNFPEELANSLSAEVIAYDRAGFGKSHARNDLPSNQFITEEADIYFSQIKSKLDIKKFVMIGHSVAGAMSLNIAANYKDCIGVVSISAPVYVEELTLNGIKNAKKEFQDPVVFDKLTKWHGDKARWVLDAWTEVWLGNEFRTWKLNRINEIFCPVLTIHGENDEFGSVDTPKFISQNVQGKSELHLIDNCGHMPHVTHRPFVIEKISDFFYDLLANKKTFVIEQPN